MFESLREFITAHQQLIGTAGAVLVGGMMLRLILPELIMWRRAWQAARWWSTCIDCGQARPDLVTWPGEPGRGHWRAEPRCWRCWETWPEDRPVPELAVGLRSPVDGLDLGWLIVQLSFAAAALVALVAMAIGA